MTIVDLDQYRGPKPGSSPCRVTFVGGPFHDPGSDLREPSNFSVGVTVGDGDYEGIIQAVIEQGGIWLPEPINGARWFLPWPCAMVRVEPA